MLDLLKDWEYIFIDDDDEPCFCRTVGRIKFYCITDYLVAVDTRLDIAKGIRVSSNEELTFYLQKATRLFKSVGQKYKQLSLL
jgi:hypothetical protein